MKALAQTCRGVLPSCRSLSRKLADLRVMLAFGGWLWLYWSISNALDGVPDKPPTSWRMVCVPVWVDMVLQLILSCVWGCVSRQVSDKIPEVGPATHWIIVLMVTYKLDNPQAYSWYLCFLPWWIIFGTLLLAGSCLAYLGMPHRARSQLNCGIGAALALLLGVCLLCFAFLWRLTHRLEGDNSITVGSILWPLISVIGIVLVFGVGVLVLLLVAWCIYVYGDDATRARWLPNLDAVRSDRQPSDIADSIVKLNDSLTPVSLYRQTSNVFTLVKSAAAPVTDGGPQTCVVCYEKEIDTCFLPCGHGVCCFECAERIYKNAAAKCPMCRTAIEKVVVISDDPDLENGGAVMVRAAYGKA